jgi:hypothetical protein
MVGAHEGARQQVAYPRGDRRHAPGSVAVIADESGEDERPLGAVCRPMTTASSGLPRGSRYWQTCAVHVLPFRLQSTQLPPFEPQSMLLVPSSQSPPGAPAKRAQQPVLQAEYVPAIPQLAEHAPVARSQAWLTPQSVASVHALQTPPEPHVGAVPEHVVHAPPPLPQSPLAVPVVHVPPGWVKANAQQPSLHAV